MSLFTAVLKAYSSGSPQPVTDDWVAQVEQQIRHRDAAAFPVPPRVLRRVIRNMLEISSIFARLPHRKTLVIDRDKLLWLVALDELGLPPTASLPRQVFLLARPEPQEIEKLSPDDLLNQYWQLLFHARLDARLAIETDHEKMPAAALREQIDLIGQTQFDEIRAVLKQEAMLVDPASLRNSFAEFIAVLLELHYFAPDLVPVYFPSLTNASHLIERLDTWLAAKEIYEATRPEGIVARPVEPAPSQSARMLLTPGTTGRSSLRKSKACVRQAERQLQRGNSIRALLALQAGWEAGDSQQQRIIEPLISHDLLTLITRLEAALEIESEDSERWYRCLRNVLSSSTSGFFNSSARLLFDLQKVCIDHERDIYRVDLWTFLVSGFRKPLKTPLPNQRTVLISKHLRSAIKRIAGLKIDRHTRTELQELLDAAAHAAEALLRKRLDDPIASALKAVGLEAKTVVETVAFRKVVEELNDSVVSRGFITIGDVRDSLSRSQLKLDDLSSIKEFYKGDLVLRADHSLAEALPGVYQPGPLYMRFFQRLSSLAFGIPTGRWLTRFVGLPYGGAYIIMEGLQHLVHEVAHFAGGHPRKLDGYETLTIVLIFGTFLLALIHSTQFRAVVLNVLTVGWKLLKGLFLDFPHWVSELEAVRWLMRSLPALIIRRYMWTPLLVTALLWGLVPLTGAYSRGSSWNALGILIVAFTILNSRVGRDTEELFTEWIGVSWHRFRVHILVALLTLIVDTFKQVMDWIERFLYAVDEWLRFRSGETSLSLAMKAVLGLFWSVINGVIRFIVTLLIEPQVNPIKHFPVVTVSHKLILPLIPTLTAILQPILQPVLSPFVGRILAEWIAGGTGTVIITCIPGVFGFLAWELKENWRLYAANRSPVLKPVSIGHHGESMLRLLKPGFHSGTIPKLFAKRRRAARQALRTPDLNRTSKFEVQLHHEAEAIQHIVDRELITLLQTTSFLEGERLRVTSVKLSTNRVEVAIHSPQFPNELPLGLSFAEQSGWLLALVTQPGWLHQLSPTDRSKLQSALAGFYKLTAVDLVHEQVLSALGPQTMAYDVAEQGLIVWPDRSYQSEVHYPLSERPIVNPRPRTLARAAGLEPIPAEKLLFSLQPLQWSDWQSHWEGDRSSTSLSHQVLPLS